MRNLTQEQLFFHTRLSTSLPASPGSSSLFKLIDGLGPVKSTTYDSAKDILLFAHEEQFYICNPFKYEDISNKLKSNTLTDGLDYRVITLTTYNDLIKQGVITPDSTDSFEWMKVVGIGDMTWYTLGEVAAAYGAAKTMTWLFPPLLGIYVFAICYQQQLNRFQNDNGREPTKEERKIIIKDCAAIGLKMTASVLGWTIASEIVVPVLLEALKLGASFTLGTSTGFLGNLTFALTTGVLAAVFFFTAAVTIMLISKGELTSNDLKDIGLTTACAFIAGIAWGLCAALPAWIGGPDVFTTVYAATAIFLSATSIPLLLYDHPKAWHTLTKKEGSPVGNLLTFGQLFKGKDSTKEKKYKRKKTLPTLTF